MITSNKVVRRLHILNCKLDDEDLIAICKALKLNSLVNGIEFTGNVIKTEGMKQLETLIRLKPTLKFLILKENKICSNDVIYLCNGIRSNNSITRLYLWHNNLGDIGIKLLCEVLENNKKYYIPRGEKESNYTNRSKVYK